MKMGRNKSTFEAENLTVDWITLNIEGLTDPSEICFKLAEYFKLNEFKIKDYKGHFSSLIFNISFLFSDFRRARVAGCTRIWSCSAVCFGFSFS